MDKLVTKMKLLITVARCALNTMESRFSLSELVADVMLIWSKELLKLEEDQKVSLVMVILKNLKSKLSMLLEKPLILLFRNVLLSSEILPLS